MNDAKYIGLDVHQATISVAVLDAAGNLVMEAILETKTDCPEIEKSLKWIGRKSPSVQANQLLNSQCVRRV